MLHDDDEKLNASIGLRDIRQQAVLPSNARPNGDAKTITVSLVPKAQNLTPFFMRCTKTVTVGGLISYLKTRHRTPTTFVTGVKITVFTSSGELALVGNCQITELKKKHPETSRTGVTLIFYELHIKHHRQILRK